ncbi:MAG: hypothetical protein ACRERE_29185 [Candidatus Entotheonellia bacterium]
MRQIAASALGISSCMVVFLFVLEVETVVSDKTITTTSQTATRISLPSHQSPLPNGRRHKHSPFLNAAPQDGHVFLTWSKYQPDTVNNYALYWRPVGGTRWNTITVYGREHQAITGLVNDTPYEFYVTPQHLKLSRSHIITQTPRTRDQCSFPGFFCSYHEADLWLQTNGIAPQSLRCQGHPITTWDINAPNCYYTDEELRILFLLNRYVDSVFTPSPNRISQRVRLMLIRTIWSGANPFDYPEDFQVQIQEIGPAQTGNVTTFSEAYSYEIRYHPQLSSRITWFVPPQPSASYALYHEGHGGTGIEAGSKTIDWLLERGVTVVNIDMPLVGANAGDISSTLETHNDFLRFETDTENPVSLFLLPVKHVVDMMYTELKGIKNKGKIMMIGRSGGGWTTALYGAVDPRIDIAVPIAGVIPLSMRISSEWPRDLGDYEQNVPHLYDVVTYEDLMKTAGTIGALFIYNAHDPCCFSMDGNSDLIKYLNDASDQLKKPIQVWIDEENQDHSLSDRGYEVLDDFLHSVQFW